MNLRRIDLLAQKKTVLLVNKGDKHSISGKLENRMSEYQSIKGVEII